MKDYQLYLENIINALSRAGISFPADFSSYESLWESSYSLGIFLDINARLQKIGSGVVLMGLDESVTFKSYWNSEFYLEYKELKTIESNFAPENVSIKSSDESTTNSSLDVLENSREGLELESASFGGLRSGLVGLSESVESSSPDSSEVYHGLDDSSSGGLDTYGVSLEKFDDDEELVEVSENPQNNEDIVLSEPVYHSIEGITSSGLDYYGVELEDYDDELQEEDNSAEESIANEEVYYSLESASSSGLDYYGVSLEDYEEEEDGDIDDSSGIIGFEAKKVSGSESEEGEVYHSIESVSSSGLDYYGVELDSGDSEEEVLEKVSEDWEDSSEEIDSSEAGFDLEEDVSDSYEEEVDFSEAGFSLDDFEEDEPEEIPNYESEEAEGYSDAGFDLDGSGEEGYVQEEEVDFSEAGFDFEEEELEEPKESPNGVSDYSDAGFDLESLDEEELVDSSEAGFSLEDEEPEEAHASPDRFSSSLQPNSPYLEDKPIRREPVRKPTQYPKEVESTTNILNFLGSMEKKFRKKRGK